MPPGVTIDPKAVRRATLPLFSPRESRLKIGGDSARHRVVYLAGPTGCGKTEISLALAQVIQGEIISADSMQIYQGMDIGTAKPTLQERALVPHHLVDIRKVTDSFNVVDFYHEVELALSDIANRSKIAIVVGGAGFYLHTLLYGPPIGPPSVPEVREELEGEMERGGAEALYASLQEQDPDYATTITVHDRQKIIRALEIIRLTGFPVSTLSWHSRAPSVQGAFRCYFLHRPRPILYQRVESRCEQMVAAGFLDEVRRLDVEGIRTNRSARNAIGYRQALDYLDSAQSPQDYATFMDEFKKVSRHYVKKQFTWFRKEPLFQWVDVEECDLQATVDLIAQESRLL